MRPSGGGHVHATEGKISRFSEGTNNAFALRKSETTNVSVGSTSAVSGFLRQGCFTPEPGHRSAWFAEKCHLQTSFGTARAIHKFTEHSLPRCLRPANASAKRPV